MIDATIEIIRLLRPRAYLIANVPGLDDGPNWPIVQKTIGSLSASGYCVLDFAKLDAADFGVPQRRVRPFWYGHLDGPCIKWPPRTHGPPEDSVSETIAGVAKLLPWVTCRVALSHLSESELGRPVRLRWRGCNTAQHGSIPERPARTVGTSNLSDGNVLLFPGDALAEKKPHHQGHKPRASQADEPAQTLTTHDTHGGGNTLAVRRGNARDHSQDHQPNRLDAPARTLTGNTHGDGALLTNTKDPIKRADEPSFTVCSGDGRGAKGACVLEWPWDRPSTGVNRDDRLQPPGHQTGNSRRSQPDAIKLSEKAGAILQGFPETWHFTAKTKRGRWEQIGMAMPPPLAEAVGRSIDEAERARARGAA